MSSDNHTLTLTFPPEAWSLMQEMRTMSESSTEREVVRDALRLYHGLLTDKLAGAKIAIIQRDESTGLTKIEQY